MQVFNPIDVKVGACLRNIRFQRGWSVGYLAKCIGVASARILDFESGATRIDARIMVEICRVLNVKPRYFFEWDRQTIPDSAPSWQNVGACAN